MPDTFYQDKLYPFQDKILKILGKADTEFYLTGGMALSRFLLNHRYSDDLDFFLNASASFKKQVQTIINLLNKNTIPFKSAIPSEDFFRILLPLPFEQEKSLQIDFVNDVGFHYGDFHNSELFPRIDNWRNILSNKISALSREEAKDVVDLLLISKTYEFEWKEVIGEANQKDAWVDPLAISKRLDEFRIESLQSIKWITPVDVHAFAKALKKLQQEIFFGKQNSLAASKNPL